MYDQLDSKCSYREVPDEGFLKGGSPDYAPFKESPGKMLAAVQRTRMNVTLPLDKKKPYNHSCLHTFTTQQARGNSETFIT